MFYHAEHHHFPLVPTCHLGALAERLDQFSLSFAEQQVIRLATVKPPNKKATAPNAAMTLPVKNRRHWRGIGDSHRTRRLAFASMLRVICRRVADVWRYR
jgi:hypothetical protein